MLPRPPISTLFPYTTLFRSADRPGVPERMDLLSRQITRFHEAEGQSPEALRRSVAALVKDRKSTRLNSSHRCISYAVFCLKKKKTALGDAYQLRHFQEHHHG